MWLLSKQDNICITVQNYLNSHPSRIVSLQEVRKSLNLSRYNVYQALEQLHELYRFEYETFPKSFEFIDEKNIKISDIQIVNVEELKRNFLHKSPKMTILNMIFLQDNVTKDDLLMELNISPALLNKYLGEMRTYLSTLSIGISKKLNVVGDEINIRRLMFELYYLYYEHDDTSFENIPSLNELFPVPVKISYTKLRAYRIGHIIWSIRLRQNYLIRSDIQFVDLQKFASLESQIYDDVLLVFNQINIDANSIQRDRELEVALLIFIMLGDVSSQNIPEILTPYMKDRLKNITQIITSEFEQFLQPTIENDHLDFIINQLIVTNIQLILMGRTLVTHPIYKPIDSTLYALSYHLSKSIGQKLVTFYNIDEADIENSIVLEYMTVLHRLLVNTKDKYVPAVHVYIDMMDLPNLSLEIKNILSIYSFMNVDDEITDKTNIVISNTPIETKHAANLVWRFLPEEEDLSNLVKITRKIIWNKMQKKTTT